MIFRICCILGLFFSFPSVVFAADWKYVGTSVKKSMYSIDTGSIRDIQSGYPVRMIKTAWFEVDHSFDKTVAHRSTKMLYHFKCDLSEMKIVRWVEYHADGTVKNTGSSGSYSAFDVAVPDSIGLSLLEAACFGTFSGDEKPSAAQ